MTAALTADYVHTVVIATFFYALACAMGLNGSAMDTHRLRYRRSNTPVMAAILVCNLALLGEILAFEWGVLAPNATYHVCMSVFLGFILYKSWVIALKRRVVSIVSAAIVVVRVVFGVWEAATCRGYLSAEGECLFDFSKSVFYGYVSIDVAGDLFAMVVAVVSGRMDGSTRLSKVLMAENVCGVHLGQPVPEHVHVCKRHPDGCDCPSAQQRQRVYADGGPQCRVSREQAWAHGHVLT
ncbi:hypothetical protein BJ741DRAFT_630676 [Chytriomyces cf. hyalinus JEL632]|nr:hypothetical protein BJ741DRAFT_630676 [Chytriomyces cf. hyalinus JEL632]